MSVGKRVRDNAEPEQAGLHILREKVRGRAGAEAIDPARPVHGLRGALDIGGDELALPFGQDGRDAAHDIARHVRGAVVRLHAAMEIGRADGESGGEFQFQIAQSVAADESSQNGRSWAR